MEQLHDLIHAPSVQMHDVPRETVGHHLGLVKDEEGWDELDERLARKLHQSSTLHIYFF